jgi:hypothetical protein
MEKEIPMSEYQYVAFRALDGPVSDENLEFMRRQSSRAEITPWSFENEYHFGDFHGNAAEMLRRGYDFHLHYASFGIRKLMIRLPGELPDARAAEPYFDDEALSYVEDTQGPGGILSLAPHLEPGDLDDLGTLDDLFERLLPLRAQILDGDLRPLYLAHLAFGTEDDLEAPVPGGLNKVTDAQRALGEMYGVSETLIAAASRNAPRLPERPDAERKYAAWLQQQPDRAKTGWLAQLMADPHSPVRREILQAFHKSQKCSSWPTVRLDRTIGELWAAAEDVQASWDRKHAEEGDRLRAMKLTELAADPECALRETEQLVKVRSTKAYRQIATLLADLRTALGAGKKSDLADKQARKLKKDHPTLNKLTAELRREGFLKK